MAELSPDEWMVQLLNFVNFILGWVIFGFALNGRSKFSTVASERAHGAVSYTHLTLPTKA